QSLPRFFRAPDPMTKPGPDDRQDSHATRATVAGALAVGALACVVFASGLSSEPSFVDEWAYLSQTLYADLWLAGKHDHPAWLEYAGYALPPLPKYVFGVALRLAGYARPGLDAAFAWYADTSSRCGGPGMLQAARWPVVAFGALGCVAIYGLGT